jgi:catechol 2,3-dioxygenase-like lactoylglutathione lyase family enzyme
MAEKRPTRRNQKTQSVRAQPLIAVKDVEASSRWYQHLLGCQSGHGGPAYEQLLSGEQLILQLHAWDAEDDGHAHMGSPDTQTQAFDAAVARARELRAEILEEPHVNPNANHRECWLRDPDGYVVVLAGA